MMYPLVRDLAAPGSPVRVPVVVACRVLGFSKQGYYRWLKNPVSDRDWGDAHLINAARDIHEDDPEFGYRFIADELAAQGFTASERRVWRLCSGEGLFSRTVRRGRPRHRGSGVPVRDDLIERDFTAPARDTVWLTDITEHHTGEGRLYLCAVKDVYSRRIVGYSIDKRMKARLAVDALTMALTHRGNPTGVIVHSDRGGQFRSRKYQRLLDQYGLQGSMGRVGHCADNAAMESFFSLLQKNVLNQRSWPTRHKLRLAIVTWIEGTYHRKRRQRALGKRTPIEYENNTQSTATLLAAA